MKNMLLVSGMVAGESGAVPSFRMVPTTMDCPYLEAQFDPKSNVLTVILKDTVIDRQMVPRLDANGFRIQAQGSKKEEGRWQMKENEAVVNHLFHILYPNEIISFVERMAVNTDDYNYTRFIVYPKLDDAPEVPKIEIVKN
mgnify:FL=1